MVWKINAFFILTRPLNVLIAGLSILVGSFIAGSLSPLVNVIFALISGSLIAAGANSINDFFDVNIDRINKPYRPITAGLITKSEAYIFSMLLFLLGAGLGWFINARAFAIALFACVMLYLYSAKLKRTVLWGNLTVSLMTAFAFIYGGIAVDLLDKAIIPAVFAFLFHFGREIIKDVEDLAGDSADNARTLPVIHGRKAAFIITTIIYVILIIVTILPYLFHIFGEAYLIVVFFGVDLLVIYVLFSMWKNPAPANLGRLSTLLKLDMMVGLISIYVGRF
ncbi:hypothetical protein GF337_04265 [candidate division KSB1 bacterium]|nr:hypothetical protein [candidate division KSB1 bacterium]